MNRINYNIYINYSIISFAFSLPISKAGVTFFSILAILLWILEGNFKAKLLELKESKFILFLSALIGVSFLSILWSPDKIFALEFMQKYWHFLVIPVIFTSLKKEYINLIISGFLSGMFISEIISYGIFFEIIQYKNILPSNPVPFMDHMNYSTYLALTSLILLNKIFFTTNIKWKIFYILYFLLTTSSLFMNGGKTGYVIFVLVIFLTMLINTQSKLKVIFSTFLLAGTIVSIAYTVSPNFHERTHIIVEDLRNIMEKNQYIGSFGQRVALWTIGTNLYLENIFFGTGIGGEVEKFNQYAENLKFQHYIDNKADPSCLMDFHNSFIQYAVQLGIVGLLFFVLILYSLAIQKFQTREYKNLNIIFLYVFILQSFTLFTFHLNHPMVLFGLFAGLLSAISKLENKEFNQ